jgi:hypothetical protein
MWLQPADSTTRADNCGCFNHFSDLLLFETPNLMAVWSNSYKAEKPEQTAPCVV